MNRRLAAVLAALAVLMPAVAGADDRAAAEAEFVRGRRLIDEGKVAEACTAFAASQRLDPQMGTLYNLATCHERAGKLASAWAAFRDLAQRDSNAKRKREASKRAKAIEPKLTSLLVTVAADTPGLAVTSNGADITRLVGIATPVDAGSYEIVATAPGFADFRAAVSATGEGLTVTVSIPVLERKPATPAQPDLAADEPDDGAPIEPPAPAPSARGSTRTIAALGIGGAGVLATGVGVVFGLRASSKWSDAKDTCGGDLGCDTPADLATSQGLVEDARSAGTISTVLVGAGAAAIIGGAVLWFWPAGDGDERAVTLAPSVDDGGASVVVSGRF